MTNEDKKIVADYMKWIFSEYGGEYYYIPKNGKVIYFDLNDASLVVQEMQKRGDDYVKFIAVAYDMAFDYGYAQYHTVTAWLFNAENFFAAMAQWLKERVCNVFKQKRID